MGVQAGVRHRKEESTVAFPTGAGALLRQHLPHVRQLPRVPTTCRRPFRGGLLFSLRQSRAFHRTAPQSLHMFDLLCSVLSAVLHNLLLLHRSTWDTPTRCRRLSSSRWSWRRRGYRTTLQLKCSVLAGVRPLGRVSIDACVLITHRSHSQSCSDLRCGNGAEHI